MLNIYLADLTGLEDFYDEKLNILHQERAEKLSAYKMSADRIRGLGAGLLLEKGLEDYLGICLPKDENGRCIIRYGYGPQGKPYFKDYTDIHFSLSHSGNMAVLAISDAEVGIDVQEDRGYSEKIAKRFYHAKEYKILEKAESVSECTKLFYQIWTGKEAYIKYTGKGMSQDLRSFSVDFTAGQIFSEGVAVATCQMVPLESDDHFCSVVFDKKIHKIDKIIKIHL